jgi:hypothetical protein
MAVHYGLSGSGSRHFAIIRNASKKPRDFVLRAQVGGAALKGLRAPKLHAEGAGAVALKGGTEVTVQAMKPGESRWVALEMSSFKAKAGVALPVDFEEVVDGKVVNGFRIQMVGADANLAVRELAHLNQAVFHRLASGYGIKQVGSLIRDSASFARRKTLTPDAYLRFMAKGESAIAASVERWLAIAGSDRGLGIAATMKALHRALAQRSGAKAFAAHVTLLNALDVAITLHKGS